MPFESQPQCAYSGKHERFVRMMRDRGHEVFDLVCPKELWDPARVFDPDSASWRAWNTLAAHQIADVAELHDIVCVIAGRCQEPIAKALPSMMVVEYGIGYGGTFSPYRVFESYAWMHTVYGSQAGLDPHRANGSWWDAVIPNYFDLDDFPAGNGGSGFVYIGRLEDRKGVGIVTEVCERLGVPLTLAGEGPHEPSYGHHVGVVGPEERATLMGSATALLVPTIYVEPFGGVAAEAMLCGTPVITTDWGAFTETVEQGVTGYRCRTFQEFLDATRLASELDRDRIRAHAISRWSLEAVAPQYDAYFERLMNLWGEGWYAGPKEATV